MRMKRLQAVHNIFPVAPFEPGRRPSNSPSAMVTYGLASGYWWPESFSLGGQGETVRARGGNGR